MAIGAVTTENEPGQTDRYDETIRKLFKTKFKNYPSTEQSHSKKY